MSKGKRGKARSEQSLRRRRPTRQQKPRILIVCEGAETEPCYFDCFRREQRLDPQLFCIVGGDECGTSPTSLVKYTKRLAKEAKCVHSEYDHIWCVFDRDQHENIENALTQVRDNKFKLAFSNPCFELWFLLHFQDQRAEIDRQAAARELRGYLPDYTKSTDVYDALKPRQQDAIGRAKALRRQHTGSEVIPPNPPTSVDKLVVFLNQMSTAATSGSADSGPDVQAAAT